jgi:hypothetical protein
MGERSRLDELWAKEFSWGPRRQMRFVPATGAYDATAPSPSQPQFAGGDAKAYYSDLVSSLPASPRPSTPLTPTEKAPASVKASSSSSTTTRKTTISRTRRPASQPAAGSTDADIIIIDDSDDDNEAAQEEKKKEEEEGTPPPPDPTYCEICNAPVVPGQWKVHRRSIAHLLARDPTPITPATSYGIKERNLGRRMLEAQGWQEGMGLGFAGDGRKVPLRPVVKQSKGGVGVEQKENTKLKRVGDAGVGVVVPKKPKVQSRIKGQGHGSRGIAREQKRDMEKWRRMHAYLNS